MQTSVSIHDGEAAVMLSGRFDFNARRDFRAAYEPLMENSPLRAVAINLGNVDYLDNSALGMLLTVRDKAGAANKKLSLANPLAGVKQVLDIANFGKLFQII